MFSLCNERCKKNNAENKPQSIYSIYVFIVAHLKRWLSSTLNHLDCSFQQNFTVGRKLEESKSVIQPFGHASGFGPQFSESVLFCRFPTLFLRFPALFRRFLSSEFSVSPCFSWFTFVLYHDNHFCRIHFRCLLDRCCKCQKATNNSSETAFCGQ